MPTSSPYPTSPRVLALVLHARYPALVVLDGFGLAPHGFRGLNLRRRPPRDRVHAMTQCVKRALARYHPHQVVIASAGPPDPRVGRLRRAVRGVLAEIHISWVERDPDEAASTVLDPPERGRRDALGRRLAESFFPELTVHVARRGEHERYRAHAWRALALALVELGRLCPRAAAAPLRAGRAPLTTFQRFLAQHEVARDAV